MKLAEHYAAGLRYEAFLAEYGSESDCRRWQRIYEQTQLLAEQQLRLESFVREMHILCMAGAWCGDCAEQCPVFRVFEELSATIHVRYIDRDEHPKLKESLTICGGARVPHVVFFSEDMQEVGRYGDRTLAKYRQMADSLAGPACSTGELTDLQQHAAIVGDWLDEFERAGIECDEDIRARFVDRIWFGCEADDVMAPMALTGRGVPMDAKIKATFGSDIGHWDVPRMNHVLEEAHEMVEDGLATEADFRDFTFTNPVTLHAGMNPDFFKGTVVEDEVNKLLIEQKILASPPTQREAHVSKGERQGDSNSSPSVTGSPDGLPGMPFIPADNWWFKNHHQKRG